MAYEEVHEKGWRELYCWIPAYSMVVEMSADSLLMVDTPYTPQNTKIVLKWINEKFGKKKITAINTHYRTAISDPSNWGVESIFSCV